MRWFQKDQRPEVWEVAGDEPLGDIEAAQKIREICASAGPIAEKISGASDGRGGKNNKAVENERYQAAIKRALELAMKISDDLMRDASVSQIIGVCMKADHLKTARILLRAIRAERTRTELIAAHPGLADQADEK